MNLKVRLAEQRRHGVYGHLIDAITIEGPFNYETGRRVEREAIQSESPIHNTEWTPREQRGVALYRRRRVNA